MGIIKCLRDVVEFGNQDALIIGGLILLPVGVGRAANPILVDAGRTPFLVRFVILLVKVVAQVIRLEKRLRRAAPEF